MTALHTPLRILGLALLVLLTSCASQRYRVSAIRNTEAGKRAMARNHLLLAHENFRRALESAKQADFGPDAISSARYNLARTLGALCQHQEAERLLKECLQDLDSLEQPERATPYRARYLFTLGNLAYDRGRYRDAAAYYGQAVIFADLVRAEEQDPGRYARILDRYADALGHAGQPAEATKVVQRATEMRKNHATSTPTYGRLRYDGFDNAAEQLLADLRRAEAAEGSKGPTVITRLLWLGVLESNRGNHEAALAFFERGFANGGNGDENGSLAVATTLDRYAHVLRASNRDQEAQAIEAKAAALRNRP